MGQLMKDVSVVVALVGLEKPVAKLLVERFGTSGTGHDPGEFTVVQFDALQDCHEAARQKRIHAICLGVEKYQPDALTRFVADVRVTVPLVSFCLLGKKAVLENFPGYHSAWRERFAHYYKLRTDLGEDDFRENAGMVRDLFIADAIKNRALGQYVTTPGAVIQLKSPRPYGYWLAIAATLVAAVVGGSVQPVMDRFFPERNASTPPAPASIPANTQAR